MINTDNVTHFKLDLFKMMSACILKIYSSTYDGLINSSADHCDGSLGGYGYTTNAELGIMENHILVDPDDTPTANILM
jgi:hypothetical protein